MIRAVIVSATIAALYCLWVDRPIPVKSVQVDWCVIDQHAAAKDEHGVWHDAWIKAYGPCDQQDIYRNI